VFLDGWSYSGVNVRGRAYFQRNATVTNVLGESTKLVTAILELNVIENVNTVTESLRATNLNGFPNRWGTECFSSMNSQVEICLANHVEGFEVLGGRKAIFWPRDVKGTNTSVAEINGHLCDLFGMGRLSHR